MIIWSDQIKMIRANLNLKYSQGLEIIIGLNQLHKWVLDKNKFEDILCKVYFYKKV